MIILHQLLEKYVKAVVEVAKCSPQLFTLMLLVILEATINKIHAESITIRGSASFKETHHRHYIHTYHPVHLCFKACIILSFDSPFLL